MEILLLAVITQCRACRCRWDLRHALGCRALGSGWLSGDIPSLTGARIEHHFNGIAARRINKFLTRPLPRGEGRILDATVPPTLEQRADEDNCTNGQRLPSRRMNAAGYEADPDAREGRRPHNHYDPQHDQVTGSRTTAVPYATISLIV
jgi:hypothetical protein